MARRPKTPSVLEPLYAVAVLADAWDVSPNTIYRLINTGELRSVDVGTGRAKTRIPKSAADEYLERRKRPTARHPRQSTAA